MTDVKGLPEHHRAYIYARAAVLAEDTSTDALDALVRRGFTDAEELRMRDRRYLAARGTVIERGEDLAVLDTHAEELLDHTPRATTPPRARHRPRRRASWKARSRKQPSRTRTTSRRCAPSPRSKHRYRRRCAWPHNSAVPSTDRHPQAGQHRPLPEERRRA